MPTPTSPPSTDLVGDIETFTHALVADLEPEPGASGPGRPRILPALALWAALLVGVLRGEPHQRAVWRRLSVEGLWQFPRFAISDEAVYKRLAQAGTAPLERLFAQVRTVLADRLAAWPVLGADDLAPFARAVVAIDETTLDPVARSLPDLRATDRRERLPGKLAGGFDLRTQQWRTVRTTTDPHQNERVLARDLVAELPPHSLVVADLGYFGFAWFDDLTAAGHWWVSRLRAGTSYRVEHTYYAQGETREQLIWLGAHRADKARYLVRLVQFRVGKTVHRYITNVTDPRRLPAGELARLYARRWDIELAVKLVKRELGLHLLWSAKSVIVWQQVWAALIIAQILQAFRLEVAGRAGVDPFDGSLPLLVKVLPRLAARGEDPLTVLVQYGRQGEIIRPSRRTRIQAPVMPATELALPPPDLPREREPRYAHRKCGKHPRATRAAKT